MFDTHCHLTNHHYAEAGAAAILAHARAAGVSAFITVATDPPDARAALKLAESHGDVWCTAGMHPLHAAEPRDWPTLREIAASERCVAWGELGLDNHYSEPPRPLQDEVLTEHLALIEESDPDLGAMPVVVHCRKAFDDLLPVLAASQIDASRFVFHCFTAGPDEARRVLDFGAMISFTGVVTFQNAPEVAEAARLVPLDRLMVETDAPYLTPAPHRKVFPNEPRYVVDVARHIAALRGMDAADFEVAVDANARRFFGI